MNMLVHVCCGPCAITVLKALKKKTVKLTAFFYNPNIQPLSEYLRRREGFIQVCQKLDISYILADSLCLMEQKRLTCLDKDENDVLLPAINIISWLRLMNGNELNRCPVCWEMRLHATARYASANGFDCLSSTLLFSRYQKHESIRDIGRCMAEKFSLHFDYADYRDTWRESLELCTEWGIFRQQYCGCVYSEYDRYKNEFQKIIQAEQSGYNQSRA